jgi:aminopeptidase N
MRTRREIGRWFAVVLAVLAAGGRATADHYPRQPGISVQKYAFGVTLSDTSDEVSVKATIDIRFAADGVRGMDLDLCNRISQPVAPDALNPCLVPPPRPRRGSTEPQAAPPSSVGRGMTITAVESAGASLQYEHVRDKLHVVFPQPSRAGERLTFTIAYHGVPATGLFIGKNVFGDRVFFTDNWPNKARNWLATIDHISVKALKTITVTAPSHYQVNSNGLLKEQTDLPGGLRRTVWEESVPIPSWEFALAVAPFTVEYFGRRGEVEFSAWLFPQNREPGLAATVPLTPPVFDFYSENIGPYSYEKLAQIEAAGGGGATELASSIFYYTGANNLGAFGALSHEMAHQWFGNSVTESDWDDVWLSEGFATYFALLFSEHHEGHDAFLRGVRRTRDAAVNYILAHPDDTVVHNNLDNDSRVFFNSTQIYQGGAMVLHTLRGVLGDQNFWAGIRLYSSRFRNASANTDDFRRAMEDACHASTDCPADGRDLKWFFREWLNRGGILQLKGTWHYDEQAKQLQVALDQSQTQGLYRMPIEIGITLPVAAASPGPAANRAPSVKIVKMTIDGQHTAATFPLDVAPTDVQLDPNAWVPLMQASFEKR